MGFREVTMEEIREVLLLWLEGVPKKRIARQLRIGPPIVRRYIATAEAAGLAVTAGKDALTDERFAEIAASLRGNGGPSTRRWLDALR
jgi:hypothetical protein